MEYFAHHQKEFVYKYVVMLSDTDQFKHMSFANYLKLMFLAADALLVSVQNTEFLGKYRLKLEDASMQFKRQTVSGDHILVKVNASKITDRTFTLLHTFIIEGTGDLVGLGKQKYELVENENNQALPLLDRIKDAIHPIEVEEEYLLYKY